MLDANLNIRFIDFGLSASFTESPSFSTKVGSPAYIAPEMFSSQPYSLTADIWSVGILLYAMTVGSLPFDSSNSNELVRQILECPPVFPPNLSAPLIDLLRHILIKDPAKRFRLVDIKSHPWFSTTEYNRVRQFVKDMGPGDSSIQCKLDENVTREMEELGVSFSTLRRALFLGELSSSVGTYKLLRRRRTTQDLATYSPQKYQTSLSFATVPFSRLDPPKARVQPKASQQSPMQLLRPAPKASRPMINTRIVGGANLHRINVSSASPKIDSS